MSVGTGSSTNIVEIFIPLRNEGTNVLRPTQGVILGPDEFRVLPAPNYDPMDEEWQFPPESIVMCRRETWNGRELLVAREPVC